MRSSSGKKGRLASLAAMPTTTRSKRAAARLTRSWCPRVIGSNVPGYTALIICPTRQKMKMHAACARAPENHPAAGRCEHRRALHVHATPLAQQSAHQRERRGLQSQPVGRVDEHDIEVRARFPGEF